MSQVSRKYISPKVQERMYEIFIKAIAKANTEESIVNFLSDMLSPVEKVMLAKRLAVAYLLIKKNYTYREICNLLKVSHGTIQRISLTLNVQGKGFRKIINSLIIDEKVEKIMDGILDIMTAIPPKGRNWGTWRRQKEEGKNRRRKAF